MPSLQTHRGLNWHYKLSGSGETVLMLHGLGATGQFWQGQREVLEEDFQILTLDLPGHGQSSWMPMTLTEIATDVREILNNLGILNFSLVASSLGGLIALELYGMVPGHIARISLVGSLPKFAKGPGFPAGLDIERIQTLRRQFEGDYTSMLDIFFRSLFTMKERQSKRFKWVKELRQQEELPQQAALKHFLDILEKTDLRDRLTSIACPLQFITGQEDYICPRAAMDWLAGRIPNARLDFIDGCGHLPFLVQKNDYNRLLREFLGTSLHGNIKRQ